MSLKLGNYLWAFHRKGEDFPTFWEKFGVLTTVSKWDSEEDKMNHLPLFLDGDAFLVFSQMSEEDKKKPDAVRARLQEAFAVINWRTLCLHRGRSEWMSPLMRM